MLVVPKLEAPGYAAVPTDELGVELATWVDGEDPYALVASRVGKAGRVAVGDVMPALHVLGLRGALPGAEQTLAGPIVRELRMRKDADEIAALRAGGRGHRPGARAGWGSGCGPAAPRPRSAADIAAAIVEEGTRRADFVIVGSGPNGASPHHERVRPGDRGRVTSW